MKKKPAPAWKTSRNHIRRGDQTLSWISAIFPHLESPWKALALGWLLSLKRVTSDPLHALSLFLGRYMTDQGLPNDPATLLRKDTKLPDFFETACPKSMRGGFYNNQIRSFLAYVLEERFTAIDLSTGKRTLHPDYHNPVPKRHTRTFEIISDRPAGFNRTNDIELTWVRDDYPQLEAWRVLAAEWTKGQINALQARLNGLVLFLERYLIGHKLPMEPTQFLVRSFLGPDFFATCCPQSDGGIRANNYVHDFLDWVLLKEDFSERDEYERPVVSPAFHNPVEWKSSKAFPKRTETNKVPLPYGYIARIRRLLISGPHFSDWTWAQGALGREPGKMWFTAPDWFPVEEKDIDRDNPDCVWRERESSRGLKVLEMWSPVRWVALVLKLLLPLRTFQVRMLDSGEADTWRYDGGVWVLNTGPLATGRLGKSRQQGFLHRSVERDGTITTAYFANTNKTADRAKDKGDKGFVFPWIPIGDGLDDPAYWVEKLRNWQEQYNPISRLTNWTELTGIQLGASSKTEIQLAGYPDTAFLFRIREGASKIRHLPMGDNHLDSCWYKLLEAFEDDLAETGETLLDGSRIRLLPPLRERKRSVTTNHPLHSLRVSLITALVIDGKVPLEIMQKVVGHARLLMTLYYLKPGESNIRLSLEEGAARLIANADATTQTWLKSATFEKLRKDAICVEWEGVKALIPEDPGARNPVGWYATGFGYCLVGGNTTPNPESNRIGGCFNGGPRLPASSARDSHGPVPGGVRNCIRCRWFLTMPHYLHALVARFNNLAYQEFEARVKAQDLTCECDVLRNDAFDAKEAGMVFDRLDEMKKVECLLESAMARWNALLDNMIACLSLISRCREGLNRQSEGMGLVTPGNAGEVQSVIQEINSELLQLSQVCEDLEVYPDLEPGKAVIRRSQILDLAMQSDGYKPIFLAMTEEDQKLLGNAFMRNLARQANPADPVVGRLKVISIMDGSKGLLEHLGFDPAECIPSGVMIERMVPAKPITINGRKNVLHNQHPS